MTCLSGPGSLVNVALGRRKTAVCHNHATAGGVSDKGRKRRRYSPSRGDSDEPGAFNLRGHGPTCAYMSREPISPSRHTDAAAVMRKAGARDFHEVSDGLFDMSKPFLSESVVQPELDDP